MPTIGSLHDLDFLAESHVHTLAHGALKPVHRPVQFQQLNIISPIPHGKQSRFNRVVIRFPRTHVATVIHHAQLFRMPVFDGPFQGMVEHHVPVRRDHRHPIHSILHAPPGNLINILGKLVDIITTSPIFLKTVIYRRPHQRVKLLPQFHQPPRTIPPDRKPIPDTTVNRRENIFQLHVTIMILVNMQFLLQEPDKIILGLDQTLVSPCKIFIQNSLDNLVLDQSPGLLRKTRPQKINRLLHLSRFVFTSSQK